MRRRFTFDMITLGPDDTTLELKARKKVLSTLLLLVLERTCINGDINA